jgi:transcription-repair coupling factor (superfamily II helicase)
MLAPLIRRIGEWLDQRWHVVLTCHTSLQAERLTDLFRWQGIELVPFEAPFETIDQMVAAAPRIRIGRLSAGFRWAQERLAVITDEEIFGGKVAKRAPVARPMEPFTSFAELAEGDHLVHEQHGIGRYRGLSHLVVNDTPGDYLLLEYLGGDRLYLPVWRLNLVGRYIGAGDTPPLLDRLGGTRWSRIQKKIREDIRLIAKDLLEIYASRQVYPGFPFPEGGHELDEFAAAFPYDETPDQAQSIDDVMRDMAIERPMDRLICGDVGYGKTEVAMRAAFRAAIGGKQVAVVVPTTVLALQHYETFTDRFAETPIAIDMLSRFRSPKERKAVIDNLRRGTVDIVIGTHRLLQKDVAFKNLGLLIIDEEQRFGVRHKERIKKLRSTVDVITLSATPIPRTLNQSLIGIRDISIINTPPADRLSISTFVAPFDEIMVRQAILKEMGRGGQVFFVHNRVETMASMHDRLKRLVPEARIVVGHGQMKERELEKVMIEFVEGEADVLLATAIIESGLDIPRANTIIINRADTFGLAQLYQLRGRVGRSNVRAYAYLLTPPEGIMTTMAKKRLTVLKRFTELGSGFQIAMHDLEFRGAGNLLGRAQSGHVAAVGYELYTKLLDRAVRKLSGKKVEEEIDPEINLKVAAFLPEDYVPEPPTRIDLYRRLASREKAQEIAALGEELADRFGPLPEEAKNLLEIMEIKILARKLRIRQITFDGAQFSCQLDAASPLETERIVGLTTEDPHRYRLVPPDKLMILAEDIESDTGVLLSAKNTLSRLIGYVSEMNS